MNKSSAKFVLFQGIVQENLGNRFYTMNDPKESEEEACKTNDGITSYKIIGYANTDEEAQHILRRHFEAF